MLTTLDNPFDPFTDWVNWYTYDVGKGYRTCQLIDSLSDTVDPTQEQLDETIRNIIRDMRTAGVEYVLLQSSADYETIRKKIPA